MLFAIGTATYGDPSYTESEERRAESDSLSRSVPRSLSEVAEALAPPRVEVQFSPPGYLLDPDTPALRAALARVGGAGDLVVVYYTGHGEAFGADGYYLITRDFTKTGRVETGVRAADLPRLLVRRDADGRIASEQPPTLLILDCCFSGAAALTILRDVVLDGTHPNLWVWATAGTTEYATSGRFAAALKEVLLHPPVGAVMDHLPLETVQAMVDDALAGTDQRAWMHHPPSPRVPHFFPNPGYIPAVAGLTVDAQHWISRARGAPGGEEVGFYLTGRTGRLRAAADLTWWITNPDGGDVAAVTGGPGTGKSTLLALPALLTDPAGRHTLLSGTAEGSLAHTTAAKLPEGTSLVAVHARGLNSDKVAQDIAIGLGRAADTVGALLESLKQDPHGHATVLVVDAVDEATEPTTLQDILLLPLARHPRLRVVLGARRHVLPPPGTVARTVDLDAERYQDPEALVDYVRQLLVAAHEPGVTTPYQGADGQPHPDTDTVAAAVAARATSGAGGTAPGVVESFLIARVIALALRGRLARVDLSTGSWARQLPDGLAAAFEEDLGRLGDRTPIARILLEALARARGPGLPWETIWVPVARAVATLHGDADLGARLTNDDVDWLLEKAGGYVVGDLGPGGRSVFRPFHDLLAEYLCRGDGDARVQMAVTGALLGTVPQDSRGDRQWVRAHPYLRTYLAEHAHAAGPEDFAAVLGDTGFLAVADPASLTPLLNHAPREVADVVRTYRRARPLLHDDPVANAAYLQEAALAVTGVPMTFTETDITPFYRTRWASILPDDSLLTLTDHTGPVYAVTFGTGADGRTILATAGDDGTVRLWDPAAGTAVRELIGHTGPVTVLAFGTGAGGRALLASGDSESAVQVWDPDTGSPAGDPLFGHAGPITVLAFGTGAGGRALLASGDDEGTVQVWDPDTGSRIRQILPENAGGLRGIEFASGGKRLITIGPNGTMQVWNPITGRRFGKQVPCRVGKILEVTYLDRLKLLAAVGTDGTMRMWDPDTGKQIGRPPVGRGRRKLSMAAEIGAGGVLVEASIGSDGMVRLWDLDSGMQLLAFRPAPPSGLPWSNPDQSIPATVGYDGVMRFWDPGTDEEIRPFHGGEVRPFHRKIRWRIERPGPPDGYASELGTMAPRMKFFVDSYGEVHLRDSRTGNEVDETLTGHGGPVSSVAFGVGAEGRMRWATVGEDHTLQLWGVDSNNSISDYFDEASQSESGSRKRIPRVAVAKDGSVRLWSVDIGPWTPDDMYTIKAGARSVAFGAVAGGRMLLASGGEDGSVRLWDADSGAPVGDPLFGHTGPVTALAFRTDVDGGMLLASGSEDGTVRLWNPDTASSVGRSDVGHAGPVTAMAFGAVAGGRMLLASGGEDGSVRLWDADSGAPVGDPLFGHTGPVTALAFRTDVDGGMLLASGSEDGTVRLWNPDTASSVGRSDVGHAGPVTAMAFGAVAGGRMLLASGGEDGSVRLWDADSGAPVGDPLFGHTGPVTALAFGTGAGGRLLLASGDGEGTVQVWDPDAATSVGDPLFGHTGPVTALAFGTGAGRRLLLASGDGEGTVQVWDPDAATPVGDPLFGHTGPVTTLAFRTDVDGGVLLASGSEDGTVRLWDPDTGAYQMTIRRRAAVRVLASVGSRLAIGDAEGMSVIE
ncbi:WD40 repeat domain-containing protein [Rhodococcus ruber]|uniref:WD40 repeat domain-containing protein n=1 Tax=Rhodococcus ruber TaxID=1830 RepID=UPI00315CEA66